MMIFILTVIFILLLIGFVMLSGQISRESQDHNLRERFLKACAAFLEGEIQPLSNQPDSFAIHFQYDDYDLIFEDLEVSGFKEKGYKGYLRIKTRAEFSLSFREKKPKGFGAQGPVLVSRVGSGAQPSIDQVEMPSQLKGFEAETDNPKFVNRLLKDGDIVRMLAKFKNTSSRGVPFLSLRISKGLIILDFEDIVSFNPSLKRLRNNVQSIEDQIEMLVKFAKKIDRLVTSL